MKKNLALLLCLVLPVGLSGCFTEKETNWGGIGLVAVSYDPGAFYYRVWSNEYPDDYTYRDGSYGSPGIESTCGSGGDSRPWQCTSTAFHCSTPDKPYRDHGNHLREGLYLKVTLYEAENIRQTSYGDGDFVYTEGDPGEEIKTQRWDNLECFKGYTLVIDEDQELYLYRCSSCNTAEEREGLTPLPPSKDLAE